MAVKDLIGRLRDNSINDLETGTFLSLGSWQFGERSHLTFTTSRSFSVVLHHVLSDKRSTKFTPLMALIPRQ